MTTLIRRPMLAVALLLALIGTSSTARAQMYEIVPLGNLGGNSAEARAINESGQVVGYSSTGSAIRGFVWEAGTMTEIGTLGGNDSKALDINDNGEVAGIADVDATREHAFIYTGGVVHDCVPIAGNTSVGLTIHPSDSYVLGESTTTGASHACGWYYSNGYAPNDLGTFSGGSTSAATGINDDYRICGYGDLPNAEVHAFRRLPGPMFEDLGPSGCFSAAHDINNVGFGDVVGECAGSAVLWVNQTMTYLGTLGGAYSCAFGINDAGVIVGRADTAAAMAAFIYSEGVITNLNDLVVNGAGWDLRTAYDINESNWIVGAALLNGAEVAFLLVPCQADDVPEPGTMFLLGLGGVALAMRKRFSA